MEELVIKITELPLTYMVEEYGGFGVILVYLYMRDKRMEKVLKIMADDDADLKREDVEEKLRVRPL